MKTKLLSLLAGTALIATISVAQASEPIALSESQMDEVTAAARLTFVSASNFKGNVNTGAFESTLMLGGVFESN